MSTLFVALTVPVIANAEPAASMSHLPVLWALASGVSGLIAWVTVKAISRTGRLQTPFRKWGLAIVLFVVLLIFLSPVIVGLGSILVTGRTM